ncbi:MAG: peptide deformylase [Paracoccaceae bacterium]
MTLRNILIHPDPRLKKVCEPVASVDAKIHALADDMLETMYDAPGVGLAGPQIGVMKQIFVIDCADKESTPDPMVLINPSITWQSDTLNTYEEGCLSIPEIYEEITRPEMVRMSYLGLDGQQHENEYEALYATATQHELDHLSGVLFIDYLSKIKRAMITNKMKKLKKERARA